MSLFRTQKEMKYTEETKKEQKSPDRLHQGGKKITCVGEKKKSWGGQRQRATRWSQHTLLHKYLVASLIDLMW